MICRSYDKAGQVIVGQVIVAYREKCDQTALKRRHLLSEIISLQVKTCIKGLKVPQIKITYTNVRGRARKHIQTRIATHTNTYTVAHIQSDTHTVTHIYTHTQTLTH